MGMSVELAILCNNFPLHCSIGILWHSIHEATDENFSASEEGDYPDDYKSFSIDMIYINLPFTVSFQLRETDLFVSGLDFRVGTEKQNSFLFLLKMCVIGQTLFYCIL